MTDDRYGDPLSLSADRAPGVLGQGLAVVAGERPSALKEARSLGGDYLGVDVNVAARVAAAAGGGQVLVSDSVCDRLGENVKLRRKWRFSGKGTPAQTKVFAAE